VEGCGVKKIKAIRRIVKVAKAAKKLTEGGRKR
jgi:hypothetical protein